MTTAALAAPAPLGLRDRVRALVESPRFDAAIIGLIVVNALTLGLETSASIMASWGGALHVFDRFALGVFVVELLLRAYVYRGRFFHDSWRVFDFVIVGIALMPATGVLSVLRALRVLRAMRLVSMVPSMRKVVSALLKALPGMASIIGLMTLVLYVGAVIATKLYGAQSPEFFGSLGKSLFTLFQVMTVEGWPDIARGIMAVSPWAWFFFVVYLLIATFMVLNLFIAVVVNAMQEQVADELEVKEEAHTQLILDEVRALRREVEALRGAAPGAAG
jgi:voltage-gated sodium channel